MSQTQVKPRSATRAIGRFLLRLISVLALALAIGAALNRLAGRLGESSEPAGFARGVAQGALMPLALPNLLVGRDVNIYAEHNSGRTYKLGYTVGVNVCGAIFFGFFFWRVSRLKKRLATAPVAAAVSSR